MVCNWFKVSLLMDSVNMYLSTYGVPTCQGRASCHLALNVWIGEGLGNHLLQPLSPVT